jgi:4a-hydroxytetrahydrobiopterin dehydratase
MPTSRLLDAEEIARQLLDLPGWSGDGTALRRTYEAADFATAIRLVDDVARDAEEMDHHPNIDIRFRTVTFALWTHVAGGVTQLDIELAHRISQEAAALSAS